MNVKANPHFYNFLAEGNILCGLKSKKHSEVIKELINTLAKNSAGLNIDETFNAVMEREKLMPTVVSPGLAVPHARMANVKQLLIALGTSSDGVDFKSPMGSANVVILILTPKDDPGLHLQVLAALAHDFKEPDTIGKLKYITEASKIIEFFSGAEADLPDHLKAKDIINKTPVTLTEADSLEHAIKTFATKKIMDIPIVDEDNDVRGVISLEDLLKFSLPEHLLWLNDLSPILHFQPFAEMLKSDKETKVADFMREEYISVDENVPAIQLAKIFMVDHVRRIIVTSKGKFAGVVDIQDFTTQLFWA
jgi:nitrogen PTS system EIIA component